MLGLVGNRFGTGGALGLGALPDVPALALYTRAIRHGGRDLELEESSAVASRIRRAETAADLDTYRASGRRFIPTCRSPARRFDAGRGTGRRRQLLLAEAGGRAVGTGYASRTSVKRRGCACFGCCRSTVAAGSAQRYPRSRWNFAKRLGASAASGQLSEDHLAVGERRGFEAFDREVELVLDLTGDERRPVPPDGIEVGPFEQRDLRDAFRVVAEGVADIPAAEPFESFEGWRDEIAGAPLVLVAREGGRVVGYAGLEHRTGDVLGHELTAVARSHRRRGIARALKQAQIAWAADRGFRRLITSTHLANEATRRLNESLGYRRLHQGLGAMEP